MRVTLIRPPALETLKGFSITGAIPPIGVAYVAAAARRAGHEVRVVDAVGEGIDRRRVVASPIGPLLRVGLSVEEIAARVDPSAEVVGISHMFLHEWPMVRELCGRVRERAPGALLVLGGENASAWHEWIFREAPAVDVVVLGEGDESFPALLDAVSAGTGLADVPGLVYRAGTRVAETGRAGMADGPAMAGILTTALAGMADGPAMADILTTGPATRIRAVDDLPRPAWDLVPLERYFTAGNQYGVERGRAMPVLATRGCPYQCTFCSSPGMWTTRYVTRDPADVVEEIATYVEQWGVEDIDFVDLTAIVKKRWITSFCERLMERGVRVTWQLPSGTRSEALDDEVLLLLHASGCRNVTYAPESGSPRVLDLIRKRVEPERLLASARAATRLGMVARVNIVIGFPGETPRDLLASLRLLLRAAWSGVQDAAVIIFAPYPGSALFHDLLASGRLQLDDTYPYLALARGGTSQRTYSEHLSAAQLRLIQTLFLALFYTTSLARAPGRLLRMLRNALAGREETQLEQFLRKKASAVLRLLRGR